MFDGAQDFSSGQVNQLVLSLSFDESVRGCTKEVSMRVQGTCEHCDGFGGEPGTKEQVCPYCRGRGEEVINTGFFHMKSTCRKCHGRGKIIGTPCRQCGGRGTTTRSQSISVQIPPGVADGQTLRVPVGSSEAYVLLKVSLHVGIQRMQWDPEVKPLQYLAVVCVCHGFCLSRLALAPSSDERVLTSTQMPASASPRQRWAGRPKSRASPNPSYSR